MLKKNSFIQALLAMSEEKKFLRNDFLLQEGQVEQHIYIVKSGAIRAFLLTELGEITIRFGYEGSIINSLASFFQEKPSQLYLQAIRQSKVAVISRTQFRQLLMESPALLLEYHQVLENILSEQIEREIDLLLPSPSERLARVLARSPQLFQEVPLKYIANYLRMTPETISRLRKS
jgi:CRP/FNR family transcriptional regulator, anaerobic regulatory protein